MIVAVQNHGDFISTSPEHLSLLKRVNHEWCVPLVIAGPGIPKGKSEAFVYLMDLYPTFAEFAGAKIPDGVEGKSIAPILTGRQTKVRDVLYTGYRNCQRAIRDDRWKLIRYPLVNRTQLFDLNADPHELTNLADKPEHKAKVVELTALLAKEMAVHADNSPLTVSSPQPAEWTPPAPGNNPARQPKKKPAAASAAAGQATGRIRVDSALHFTNWDTNKDGFVTQENFNAARKTAKVSKRLLRATIKTATAN